MFESGVGLDCHLCNSEGNSVAMSLESFVMEESAYTSPTYMFSCVPSSLLLQNRDARGVGNSEVCSIPVHLDLAFPVDKTCG
jgi:hypothetical protein